MWTPLHLLLVQLPQTDQTAFFNTMLRDLTRRYLKKTPFGTGVETEVDSDNSISGVAAIVKGLVAQNDNLKGLLVDWLTATSGEYAILGLDTRRAIVATLALHEGTWTSVSMNMLTLLRATASDLESVLGKLLGQSRHDSHSYTATRG